MPIVQTRDLSALNDTDHIDLEQVSDLPDVCNHLKKFNRSRGFITLTLHPTLTVWSFRTKNSMVVFYLLEFRTYVLASNIQTEVFCAAMSFCQQPHVILTRPLTACHPLDACCARGLARFGRISPGSGKSPQLQKITNVAFYPFVVCNLFPLHAYEGHGIVHRLSYFSGVVSFRTKMYRAPPMGRISQKTIIGARTIAVFYWSASQ